MTALAPLCCDCCVLLRLPFCKFAGCNVGTTMAAPLGSRRRPSGSSWQMQPARFRLLPSHAISLPKGHLW